MFGSQEKIKEKLPQLYCSWPLDWLLLLTLKSYIPTHQLCFSSDTSIFSLPSQCVLDLTLTVTRQDKSITGGNCHKYHFVMTNMLFFCCDKSKLAVTKYFCHDKSFVMKNICCDKHVCCNKTFVMTSIPFLCDKRCVFCHKTHVCHDKSKLVATKLSLQQNYVCHDKKMYVMTKALS